MERANGRAKANAAYGWAPRAAQEEATEQAQLPDDQLECAQQHQHQQEANAKRSTGNTQAAAFPQKRPTEAAARRCGRLERRRRRRYFATTQAQAPLQVSLGVRGQAAEGLG